MVDPPPHGCYVRVELPVVQVLQLLFVVVQGILEGGGDIRDVLVVYLPDALEVNRTGTVPSARGELKRKVKDKIAVEEEIVS